MQRLAITVFLLALVAPAALADFTTAMMAYEQGNYVEALEGFRPLARRGNADAQYRLGLMYEHGRGVNQDYAQAAEWYQRAAEQEHARARTNLGSLYFRGDGVERDLDAAHHWYRLAAAQGRAVAQNNLGKMYESGEGVGADLKRAAGYYRLSAEQGNADGQYALGLLHEAGRGVPQSDERAVRLFLRAAKQNHADAQQRLASCYAEGRGVKRNANKASNWYRAAAANGSAEAQQNLDAFYTARGDLPPLPEASPPAKPPPAEHTDSPETTIAPSAASPEVRQETPPVLAHEAPPPIVSPDSSTKSPANSVEGPAALYERGQQYARGLGVPKDEREAVRWYLQAAEQGHELAGYRVALLYLRGRGIEEPDLTQAHLWFSISAARGVGDAADWRDRIAGKLTKRQRADSERLLAEHLARGGS